MAAGDASHEQEKGLVISLREHRLKRAEVAVVLLDERKITIATEEQIEVR